MHRSIRAIAVAAVTTLAATAALPSETAAAADPPVLTSTASLLPSAANDTHVGPDGTTYVVGTTYKIDPLEHSGSGAAYEAYVFAYAPDGTLRDSRYLGGSGNDYGQAVTTSPSGAVVVTGSTLSTDFPTTLGNAGTGDQGGDDVFVTVLSPDLATIQASAVYGGGGTDVSDGLAVDGAGRVWVSGWSNSAALPVTAGPTMGAGGQDAFVLAFGGDLATRPVSRRIGGAGYDDGNEIVGLPAGGAAVVGRTTSADFPAVGPGVGGSNGPLGAPGQLDAFAARISGTGDIAWTTRFGAAAADEAFSVALDPAGNIVVGGATSSTGFPATAQHGAQEAGAWRGFVTTLAPTGDSLVQSTVIGGTGGNVEVEDVAVDSRGDLYLAATANATTVPLPHGEASGGDSDAYVGKLSADGSQLSWATELGTAGYERAYAVSLHPAGTVNVVGSTPNTGYPGATPSPVTTFNSPGLLLRVRSTPHVTAVPDAGSTTDRTPTLAFAVDVAGARTECRVDGSAWAPCDPAAPSATTYTTPELAGGVHTVEVRASDFPGVYGPSATTSVTVLGGAAATPSPSTPPPSDTTAPQTVIAKHPAKRTGKARATFRFRSEPGATFTCKLDKRAWRSCGPRLTVKVKPGRHRIQVRATDAAGNTDATPAAFRWKRR